MAVPPPAAEVIDPRHIGQIDAFILRPAYEFLIGMDPANGKLVPQLATAWQLEPDGLSVRLKLRDGVRFHDNAGALGAQDVVHTFSEFVKEDSKHGGSPRLRRDFKGAEVLGPLEVRISMQRPQGYYETILSENEGNLLIQSKADYDAHGDPSQRQRPTAGTGPYQFKGWEQGSSLSFERVPYQHWRTTPDFPTFQFRWMKEASTRMAALLAGEVHVTTLPEDLLRSTERQGFKVAAGKVAAPRLFLNFWCCYFKDPKDPAQGYLYPDSALMDVRVRRALSKAINRDELNNTFFGGKGEYMRVNHLHPTRPGWNPEWERQFDAEYGYNPTAAKTLLTDAGRSNLRVNLFIDNLAQFPGTPDLLESVATYWRAVGVNVDQVTMDPAQKSPAAQKFEFSNHVSIVGTSGNELVTAQVYSSSTPPRGTRFEEPETDALLRRIEVEMDAGKREQLWRQWGDQAYRLHNSVPLFWLPAAAVFNPEVIASYPFPGSVSGTWTHVETMKAAR